MKRLTIILILGCLCACSTNATDEVNVAENQLFPLSEGNTWIYETTEFKNDSLVHTKQDTLVIEEKFEFQGLTGWYFSDKTTNYFGLNNNLIIASKDSILSKLTTRSGTELLTTEFVFSPEDTVKINLWMGDHGVNRIMYLNDYRNSFGGTPYKAETEFLGGTQEMTIVTETGITLFNRFWKDKNGNEYNITSKLLTIDQ